MALVVKAVGYGQACFNNMVVPGFSVFFTSQYEDGVLF